MSFPRAKIQRFNDATSCAPPPGRYDPKFEAKVKGAVIEKSERFVEPKYPSVSTSSAESPANMSLTSSSGKSANGNCLPVFRTPQLPRRIVKQVSSAPQTKMKLKFEMPLKNGGPMKEVNADLYEALLVDRDNKDATIHDNEVHIDELYERIRNLENTLSQLQAEKDESGEVHKMGELADLRKELEKTSSDLLEVQEKCSVLEDTVCKTRTLLASAEQEKQNLLLKINQVKDNEEKSRCRYEMDIKELDSLCKKLVDDMVGVRAEEDEKKKELEEQVKKLKEELSNLSNTNSDLDSRLNQKQQMILMLQSELSSAELELEECKSENEKMVTEEVAMTEKYGSDMTEMKALIKKLETLLSEEREMRMQEIHALEENVLNSSLVRENLETIITDKQSALSALNDKYLALEAEVEKSCMEQKLVTEAHRLEMDDICHKYERELNELMEKEKEAEKRIESVTDKYNKLEADFKKSSLEKEFLREVHRLEINDIYDKHDEEVRELKQRGKETEIKMVDLTNKYCALEREFGESCLEKSLMTESYKLELDEINRKHEDELCKVWEEVNDKGRELGRIKNIMEGSVKEAEERVREIRAAAEEKLEEVQIAAEKRMREFEVETAEKINDCRTRVDVKLKDAELQMNVYAQKAMQAEEELRHMTHHRDELRISNMENQLTVVDMQDKIDTLVTELNTARESYEADLNQARNEHEVTKKQCKKLKIGISNIQASLEALQMRLLESEHDVEQLTNATHQVQAQKAALEEQVNILTQKLEDSRQSMSQLETDTVKQIENTHKDLLCKLEDFKEKADKNIAAKEEEILEYRHKTKKLSARIFELTETLSAIEETNTVHEREIEALTEKIDHQRDCAKIATQQIATLEASNAIYQHQVQALTAELEYQKDFSQKASDHIAGLATAKANQDKAICNLTSELMAEREKILKLHGEIEEPTTLMNFNSESSSDLLSVLKENFEHYKSELMHIIQTQMTDIKTKEFDIDKKNIDICRKKCEIKSATDRITELVSENTKKEEKIADHNQKIEELCSQLKELKTSLQAELDSELMLKLAEKEKDYQSLLNKAKDWEKCYKEMELLIGPFREQLEAFDAERQALELQKEVAESEMRELGLRYAEILGHQNHKQKIKHMIKLKDEINELKKENDKLDSQVRTQKRLIDKLKDEPRSTSVRKPVLQQHNQSSTRGKENVDHSPIRKSPVSSPKVKALQKYR